MEVYLEHEEATSDRPKIIGYLDLVRAGGTLVEFKTAARSTKANDLAETSALAAIFPETEKLTVVSTKGFTGHTLGAAGGIEAILLLMALRNGRTPGTISCREVDPEFPLRPLAGDEIRDLHGSWGISQSLAFGGGNSALVLEAGS